jgi:hypothetical protein
VEPLKDSHTLGGILVDRGNGIPKESEVDKRRDVCECEGCVCVNNYRITIDVTLKVDT